MANDVVKGPYNDPSLLTPQAPIGAGDEPVYLTIRDAVAEAIRSGALVPNARLPSERDLAERHGVARMTARKALAMLEADGAIYSAGRRGYFVSPPRIRYDPASEVNLMRQLRNQGLMAENIYLDRQVFPATPWYAAHFEAPEGTELVLERSVVEVDGRRVLYEEDALLLAVLPGYLDEAYVSPMTQNLARNYDVHLRRKWSRARVANISSVASRHLGVATDTLGVSFTHVSVFQDRVAMVARTYWIADTLELDFFADSSTD